MPVLPFEPRPTPEAPSSEHPARTELEAVVDALPILIAAFDREARLMFLNDAGGELIGLPAPPPNDLLLSDLYPETEAERILAHAVPTALSEGAWVGRARLADTRGGELETWQHLSAHAADASTTAAFTLAAGPTSASLMSGSLPDPSSPENDLGLVHSINNVLGPIRAYADLAAHVVGSDHRAARYIDQIVVACERGRALSQRLSAASRERRSVRVDMDLVDSAREVTTWLRALRPDLVVRLESELPKLVVVADPAELHQVLMNLAQNALDALSARPGTIALRLEVAGAPETEALPRDATLAPGRYAVISVTDDGPGISSHIEPEIFEPHFTTKPWGQGLGLAVSRRIVEQHGGILRVRNRSDAGVAATIYLPLEVSEAGSSF